MRLLVNVLLRSRWNALPGRWRMYPWRRCHGWLS